MTSAATNCPSVICPMASSHPAVPINALCASACHRSPEITPDAPSVTWKLSAGKSQIVTTYEIQPKGSAHPFQRDFFLTPIPSP